MDNTSGRRWARFALIFGASMSILGNETHTVLTPGPLNIVIRMVLAFIWPAGLFVAVEVLVRVNWRHQFIDYAGRVIMMVPVSMVAAVVSYQHLHALMMLGGEDAFSAAIGPLAIDGLMLGGTVALLAIRAATLAPSVQDVEAALERLEAFERETQQESGQRWTTEELTRYPATTATFPVPVSPAPQTRIPRGEVSPALRAAVAELIEGVPAVQVSVGPGASRSVIARYAKVLRALRDDPNALIDIGQEKVRLELVDEIRAAMRQERVR